MPHADSAYVPESINTKQQFYTHVAEQLLLLLEGSRYWVSNLAQTASLLSHSYLSSPLYGYSGDHTPKVNWVGFYLNPPGHSSPSTPNTADKPSPSALGSTPKPPPLLLGPYIGRPACINITPTRGKGVCADTFLTGRSVVVPNVEAYPGHIACDGDTKSEIVIPLRIPSPNTDTTSASTSAALDDESKTGQVIGVLDLDSTSLATFDEDDRVGLERIVQILRDGCDWA